MTANSVKRCAWKVHHSTIITARQHAKELNERPGVVDTWQPYDCNVCKGFHVGRRGGRRNSPYGNQPKDITLYNEIGRKAYYCGMQENESTGRRRYNHIVRLGIKAQFRARYNKGQ